MTILGLDCGSSSIKAAILRDGRMVGKIVRSGYPTHTDGIRAEISPAAVLGALRKVIHQLGSVARKVDWIALDVMAPSWIAMDKRGRPLTPIITHQDRRSVEVARQLEKEIGQSRILHLSGNRPFPGGISSTTWAWFARHHPGVLKKADLVGHLSTFLHRALTGERVTDPSNASFMGVYSTLTMTGWNEELWDAVGADRKLLPDVLEGDRVGGKISNSAARRFGLTAGTPMLAGVMDTSAALLLVGAPVGQLLNVCGTTDVLALCTDHPRPNPRLLTRCVGVGRRWMQVSTLASAGSSLIWAHQQLCSDLSTAEFEKLTCRLALHPAKSSVRFEPYLAGERVSIEQRTAAFTGMTLATKREHLLTAIIESLAATSAARLPLLKQTGTKIRRNVLLSGGVTGGLAGVLHRDWPGRWIFREQDEATLRGLAMLVPRW
jgi:xylulokinase